MKPEYFLTGWHSGKWPGGTYGLRFGRLREVLIDGKPDVIELLLEGGPSIEALVSLGFWKQCPEVRHQDIGPWMRVQGVKFPWPLGKPPNFRIERVRTNRFKVSGQSN